MKILTICSAGAVRSVGMAYLLKEMYGHDAIPVGHDLNSQQTIDMLADWADLIIVMQPQYAAGLPMRDAHKIIKIDIGPDIWGNSLHPDLLAKLKQIAYGLHQRKLI
jgi:predicted protein tyrosine phosphatase